MIDNYSDLELTAAQQKYLETSITYEDGEEVLEHQQLLAGDTAVYKVRVAYKLDLEADDLPDSPEQLDLEFSVEFVQRDSSLAIERRVEANSLYNVLKRETESGSGFALKYTGAHQDSIDTSLSTKDIYHWYASDSSAASQILDKNNVIFGGYCWQMYRTTDTGGVRMIYNGRVNEGKCDRTGTSQQLLTYAYNTQSDSLADIGYMYNTRYTPNTKYSGGEGLFSQSGIPISGRYYSDSYTYDSTTNKYTLVNPTLYSSGSQSADLDGKYTIYNDYSSGSSTILYYMAVNDSGTYILRIADGHDLNYYVNSYTYGDSYTDNGNGTYTINSPTTITTLDFPYEYSNLSNKYACKNAVNNTCDDLIFMVSASGGGYNGYKSSENCKYAKGFTYNNGVYILSNDSVSFWNKSIYGNVESLDNYHYTCWNESGQCETISYIYYKSSSKALSYINLVDGKSVEDAIDEMLFNDDVNQIDSTIKAYIDSWYVNYGLIDYASYLEDTVFCFSRAIYNKNGWNPNGGSLAPFLTYSENNDDLTCEYETDRYSLNNPKAQLTYPIGLLMMMKFIF